MEQNHIRRTSRRFTAFLLAAVLFALLLPMGGCSKNKWEGEWNRTGDSTFTRAIMTITNAGGSDFDFSITLYNGNVAGQVTNLTATYNDSSKTSAHCVVPDTRAYIDFTMDEYGALDVTYGYQIFSETAVGLIESELFGFEQPAYITGHYQRGEVSYLNDTLYDAGILTQEEDQMVRKLMIDSSYERLLDCFQTWKISNGTENPEEKGYDPHSKKNRHEDEIGAYVYYGSNTMQEYAAMIIIYDDGTVSVVVSMTDSAPIYYSNNSIYKDGSLTPLPVKEWLEDYNKEQEKIAAAAAQQ